MKIALNPNVCTINQYRQKRQNVAFGGNATTGLSGDSLEKSNNAKSLFENILIEFSDKINLEKDGNKTKIPNCIMFETRNEGVETLPIEWLKKTADCNFVHLTDRNNDDLADTLWEELKKSKETFEQTNRRTAIHVEGFDRLITSGQNSFENIDSIKDIMSRTAKDFGATIIFSTKDTSKLTSEAIQPQRVTKFIINNSKIDFEKYNAFLDSRGYFKDYEKRITSKPADVPKPEIKKDTTEVPSKQVEQPKSKTETKKPEVQAEQHESGKSSDKSNVSTPKQTESPKSNVSGSDAPPSRQSSEQKSSAKNTCSSTSHKNETEIKPPKAPDVPPQIKKATEKADGPKAFKVVAILVAIGTAIAGVIYFMKNKNKNQGVNESLRKFNET